jgi:hypothetical protein
LCQNATDWKWSSARWYASDGKTVDEELPELTPVPVVFWERTTLLVATIALGLQCWASQ